MECIDEGRTKVIPPEFWDDAYYIKDSIEYLLFEFVLSYLSGSYSSEAKEMFMRVIPLYENRDEYERFTNFIKNKGFSRERICEPKMSGEALRRLSDTKVLINKFPNNLAVINKIAVKVKENKDLVFNFANSKNKDFNEITRYLKVGKMLVDWLDDWRNFQN